MHRLFCASSVLFFVLNLWTHSAFCQTNYSFELADIDRGRLSSPEQSRERLIAIPMSALSSDEREYYQYLSAYFLTFDGDLDAVITEYSALLEITKNADIRIRTLSSLINLLGAKKQWQEGFYRVEELLALLQKYPESTYRPAAYIALALIYKQINQPETALHFAERALSLEDIDLFHKCLSMEVKLDSIVSLDYKQLVLSDFTETDAVCNAADLDYELVNIAIWKIKWLKQQARYQEALNVVELTLVQTEKFRQDSQLIDLYNEYASLYLALKQYDKAQQYAELVAGFDNIDSFVGDKIKMYDVLRQIAEVKQDFNQAYYYLNEKLALEKSMFESKLANEMAIQKAWFEVDAKQSQIELLDKQNDLLKTESQLTTEQLENSLLALSLVSLLLATLLFWSFRSRKVQAKLRYYAHTDGLTKIANRGFFTESVESLLSQAQKNNNAVSLILLDLDHFKNINDTYGHQVGDWALIQVAATIRDSVTENAIVGRLGGEEFGVALMVQDSSVGLRIAEECRQAIDNIDTNKSGYNFKLTVSAGVGCSSHAGYKLDNLYAAADLALYQSKQYGRNRVYEYSASMAS
ncbi:GGDEF domain-containing protein [Aestuariibacter sp. GS-14]|nr:GGDEF domain-containing protein [Aestuariibacter sp. GS-14]